MPAVIKTKFIADMGDQEPGILRMNVDRNIDIVIRGGCPVRYTPNVRRQMNASTTALYNELLRLHDHMRLGRLWCAEYIVKKWQANGDISHGQFLRWCYEANKICLKINGRAMYQTASEVNERRSLAKSRQFAENYGMSPQMVQNSFTMAGAVLADYTKLEERVLGYHGLTKVLDDLERSYAEKDRDARMYEWMKELNEVRIKEVLKEALLRDSYGVMHAIKRNQKEQSMSYEDNIKAAQKNLEEAIADKAKADEREALSARVQYEKELAQATYNFLCKAESLLIDDQAYGASADLANFRKELQPLARTYGVKIVLVGDRTKANLVKV